MDFFRWAMTATRRAGAETAASMRSDLSPNRSNPEMNTVNPPTTHAATRAGVPGSAGRITSRNTSTATALFNAWPDRKLNPGAVAVGVSKLGRARAITSLSTNPSMLPAVILTRRPPRQPVGTT
jgi:hypothetical protein